MNATSTDKATSHDSRYTVNGKELRLFLKQGTSLYCVRFADGGELPEELNRQMFTSPKEAYAAIDTYLERKSKEKEKKTTSKDK